MKVLFLDIDGVLNTSEGLLFHTSLLRNLKTIIDATEAKIVLSSDWRRTALMRTVAWLALRTYGLAYEDCTPCLPHRPLQRPREIIEWMRAYAEHQGREPITQWLVVDDRTLLLEVDGSLLEGHFVKTHSQRGLTEALVPECIKVLSLPECKDARMFH